MPVKNGISSESRITVSDSVVETLAPATAPPPSALNRLLRMADQYRANNMLRQAMEIYWDLVEQNPDTPEAAEARQCLLAIGEQYERDGKLHQARAMYERLR